MNEMESRTMRMYLQSMPKLGFICVYVVFVVVFATTLLIGFAAGPSSVLKTQCGNSITEVCKPFDLNSQAWEKPIINLDKLNQQLFVRLNVTNEGKKAQKVKAKFRSYAVELDSMAQSDKDVKEVVRTIECKEGEEFCKPVYLLHYDFIHYSSYTIRVEMTEIGKHPLLAKSYIDFSYFDEEFTLFELWFRFTFLILTFVCIVVFAHKLRNYRWTDWQVEQKWTAFILFGLMAADNPFFALELIFDGWFPTFFDQVMLVTFIAMLFFFWLVMFDGVRKDAQQRTMLKFYVPKLALVGLLWITTLVVFTMIELRSLSNPEYAESEDDPNFTFFLVGELILAVIYLFWVVYVVCRACSESRTFPLLGVRIRFFALFTLTVVLIMVLGIVFEGFGPTTAVSGSPMGLLAYLALYNYYVYVLAFMYLPSRFAAKGGARDQIGMVRFEDDADSLEEEIDH
mmetsp:Transcript_18550/g.32193  ORF Transcript_18550/g.32193 Transcript_18550/m.32193 type:complete len:455 (-) Transcript_18550:24-1388(-)